MRYYSSLSPAQQAEVDSRVEEHEPLARAERDRLRRQFAREILFRQQEAAEREDPDRRKPRGHDGQLHFLPCLVESLGPSMACLVGRFLRDAERKIARHGVEACEWDTASDWIMSLGLGRIQGWRLFQDLAEGERLRQEAAVRDRSPRQRRLVEAAKLLRIERKTKELRGRKRKVIELSPRPPLLKLAKQRLEWVNRDLAGVLGFSKAVLFGRIRRDSKAVEVERTRKRPGEDLPAVLRPGPGFTYHFGSLVVAMPWLRTASAMKMVLSRLLDAEVIVLERLGRRPIYRVQDDLLRLTDQALAERLRKAKRGGSGHRKKHPIRSKAQDTTEMEKEASDLRSQDETPPPSDSHSMKHSRSQDETSTQFKSHAGSDLQGTTISLSQSAFREAVASHLHTEHSGVGPAAAAAPGGASQPPVRTPGDPPLRGEQETLQHTEAMDHLRSTDPDRIELTDSDPSPIEEPEATNTDQSPANSPKGELADFDQSPATAAGGGTAGAARDQVGERVGPRRGPNPATLVPPRPAPWDRPPEPPQPVQEPPAAQPVPEAPAGSPRPPVPCRQEFREMMRTQAQAKAKEAAERIASRPPPLKLVETGEQPPPPPPPPPGHVQAAGLRLGDLGLAPATPPPEELEEQRQWDEAMRKEGVEATQRAVENLRRMGYEPRTGEPLMAARQPE